MNVSDLPDIDDGTHTILPIQSALKQIAWGSMAGMIGELFDYPFDLAKVRLQAQLLTPPSNINLRFKGPLDTLARTWKDEGTRGLYRGLPLPLIGSMIDTGAVFVTYAAFQNVIRSYSYPSFDPGINKHPPPLSLAQLSLAAAGAGLAHSFIITPIELIKCKMQVQMLNTLYTSHHRSSPHLSTNPVDRKNLRSFSSTATSSSPHTVSQIKPNSIAQAHTSAAYISQIKSIPPALPPGPIATTRSTFKAHGLRGLYLGHSGTMIRETGGTAVWFAVKEWVAGCLQTYRLGSSEPYEYGVETSLHAWESALSGAIAGAFCVASVYPVDTVKNAMQTQEELRSAYSSSKLPNSKPKVSISNSFWRTSISMYRVHGLTGLYAGCGMTVARTIPSSGIVFVVYDGLCELFGS